MMNNNLINFASIFITIFLAEMGDKTQLATMLFASDKDKNSLAVFLAASLALIAASGISVLLGSFISHYVSPKTIKIVAGISFIGIGIWTIFKS